MKSKKKAWIFVAVVLMMITASVTTLRNVTAVTYQGYKTTITDRDGLDIEVVDIYKNDTIDIENYIKQNVDSKYSNINKMEAKDIMFVKNLIAQESNIDSAKTINSLWNNSPEAFIMMNDAYVLLYDLDENSNYYVAYVNTMKNDNDVVTTDYQFAYTNVKGETIDDAIYDYSSGLAYIPKKYTEENKNGMGYVNIQVELLQVTPNTNPKTSFDVTIEKDEDIKGKFADNGYASVQAIATEFGIKVALDKDAINSINQNYIKVSVNGNEIDEYVYYEAEGIIVLEQLPSSIQTINVSISKDNIEYNKERQNNSMISPLASFDDIPTYQIGEWIASDMPTEGALLKITKDQANMWYDAWDHDSPNGYQPGIPIHSVGSGDAAWKALTSTIKNGTPVDINNLQSSNAWIQWNIDLYGTTYVTDDRGIQWEIPQSNWLLKCVHCDVELGEGTWRQQDPDGHYRWHAKEMWVRIFKVTNNYLLVGMLTPDANTQAGAGLFKVAYTTGTGNLEVGKKDDDGNWVSGAKLGIWGPDGYYSEVWTEDGKTTLIPDLKKGDYTVRELQAPQNMIISVQENVVTVRSNETAQAFINNKYQKGKATLTKYDERNTGDTQGNATIEGAEFNFCAATDINEGPNARYKANQVIKTVVTDANGNTETITDLPIGEYYYIETKASEGFMTNGNRIPAIVEYTGQENLEATHAQVTCPEKPIYNDLVITKYRGETTNTEKAPIAGAVFTARLDSNPAKEYVSTPTDANGYCIIEDMPYGHYTIEETTVPDTTLKCSDFKLFVEVDKSEWGPYTLDNVKFVDPDNRLDTVVKPWLDDSVRLVEEPKVMQIKIRKVDKDGWEGKEKVDFTQGDAVLKDAVYQIYEWQDSTNSYSKYLYDITVNHKDSEGYWCAESGDLIVGRKYMVKEKVKYTETVGDKTYKYSYAKGYLVDENEYEFYQDAKAQTSKRTYHSDISKEEVIRGAVYVVKYDNQLLESDEVPSKGAILRLTLDSSKNTENPVWYEATIDEKGYAEFIDKNDDMHTTSIKTCYGEKYYPNTIPFGDYTITEVKESDYKVNTSFFVKPEPVKLERQTEKQYRIEADEPVQLYIRIQKRDKDTGATVELTGAKFKVWDIKNNKWVEQMSYNDGGFISEFTTDETGKLNTPEKVEAGEYIIYETHAPEGYYLCEELRIPENKNDLGKIGKGGKYINATKAAMGIPNDTIANNNDYFYTVDMSDPDLKTRLRIIKTGEMLTGVNTKTTEYGELYTPVYEQKPLKGVTYEIRTAERIMSPDGRTEYEPAGTLVATITTNDDGIAQTGLLHPGKYSIKEVKTPEGYLTDKNIKDVTLESSKNELEYERTTDLKLENNRQKLEFTFEKEFKKVDYSFDEEFKPEAEFAVYTNQDIKDCNGNIAIPQNKLVDIITVNSENTDVTSNVDLPKGKYYTREEKVTYPYVASIENKEFELTFKNNVDPFVVKQLSKVVNDYDYTDLTLIKVSSSIVEGITVKGDKLDLSEVDQKAEELLNTFNNMTLEEVIAYIEANNVPTLKGAKYGIYLDKEGTTPLYKRVGDTEKFEPAQVVSGENGLMYLDKLPIGVYYLIELEAPVNAEKKAGAVEVNLDISSKGDRAYRMLSDADLVYPTITKLDVFTGKAIENCVFEVTDKDGNILCHSITNEKGEGYIPTVKMVDGETYYYTEIDAPEIYNLNKEPHPFVAHLNDKKEWVGEKIKVENERKTSTVTLTKLDMVDSTVIPNCKFVLQSLDNPEWKEEGVTDENGIYVFENVPYGKYTYTELEAPEEYLIDTEPHEITIDAEDVKIVVKDDRVPTGDIAVFAILGIAIISIVGIAVVTKRNKKAIIK